MKEVVRQLRLRDIGGIIVIDFIDMANPKNRETVEEALRSELERDRTKTYVVEISPLGLVEMTRQNVTDGPREILTSRCHVCEGAGVVVSDATHALEIERKLRAIAKGSRVQAFKIAVHPRVLALLVGPGGRRLTALDAASRRRFFLVPAAGNGHVHLDHFEVIAQGKLETTRPSAPVEEGSSVELKLVEVGLHDPTAAVGKVDGGYEVVVAGAAKLVGKKVTATVGSVLEGAAYATLADDLVADATPITFEAEAEKPMRASRSKKEPLSAEAPVETATSEGEIEDELEDDAESTEVSADALEVEAEVSADGATKKKRTRRGTRGGRNRKKPVSATPAADAELDSAAGDENGRPAPKIHVPPADLVTSGDEAPPAEKAAQPARKAAQPAKKAPPADEPVEAGGEEADGAVAGTNADGLPKRKRSRRGSRGGKKRSKPTVSSGVDAVPTDGDVAVEVAVEAAPDGEAPAYVPMSEWIDDFDSRSRT